MTTGQLIKAARKRAGMTQAELADKLNIPYQSVSQWERDTRNPKYETLQRIAAALGVEWTELVPESTQGAVIAAHVIEGAGLTLKRKDGSVVQQGNEKPWEEMSTTERAEQLSSDFSKFARVLKELKETVPERIERAGFSLAEVDESIEKMEDWTNLLTAILEMGGFSKEGAKKVAAYAEDILPRYRATATQESAPSAREGNDTTPPPDTPQRPQEDEA